MATITSANAILMLSIQSIFPAPVQIQGFAVDDIYDMDVIDPSEVLMGVDGILSAGFVFVPLKQNYALQADSASNDIFEQWYLQQQVARDIFFASGNIVLPSLGRAYVMNKGVLSGYKPIADGKKVLQPRKFAITWESVGPGPV
jgi:hypothetical protein